MKRMNLFLLLAAILLLSACGGNPEVTEAPTETPSIQNPTNAPTEIPTQVPTEAPTEPEGREPLAITTTYEELGEVPLPEITPENRCSMTTLGRFAESEGRYYMVRKIRFMEDAPKDYIYYAEKTDPTVWLPLCAKEGCQHELEDKKCLAYVDYVGGFWLTEEGIFFYGDAANLSLEGAVRGRYLVRLALDGFSREAYYTDSQFIQGPIRYTPDAYVVLTIEYLEEDYQPVGTYYVVSQTDATGSKTLFCSELYPLYSGFDTGLSNSMASIRGNAFLSGKMPMDGSPDEDKNDFDALPRDQYVYQVHDGKIIPVENTAEHPYHGAYIYGNHYYHYHQNDGFYYRNLLTEEETKVADVAYENGQGICVDGTMMVETNMDAILKSSLPLKQEAEAEATLRYFYDGAWYEVETPEQWTAGNTFELLAVASDRLFFEISDSQRTQEDYSQWKTELCYVLLGETKPVLFDSYPCYK